MVLLLTLFSWSMANATLPETGARDQMESIRNSYKISKSRVIQAEEKQRKVLGALYSINSKMKKMSQKRDRLTDRMLAARGDVRALARDIAQIEEQIKAQRKILAKRLQALYKLGSSGVLPVLFSATSAHQLDRILKYLKVYSEKDYAIIKSYEENVNQLKIERAELHERVKHLVKLQKRLKSQENLLEEQQGSKSLLLSRLKQERAAEIKRLKSIKNRTTALAKKFKGVRVDALLDNSFFEKKGKLFPPVEGEVSQEYGLVQHEEYKFKLSHKGLFFSTPKNTPIESIHEGQVEFIGSVPGYGRTVVVDHGDHYYTVYSHTERVQVSMGQTVKARQVIAYSGAGADHFGEGIYFEIRHFSDAIDPKNWLVAQKPVAQNL